MTALDTVLFSELPNIEAFSTDLEYACYISYRLLEKLFEQVLDYQEFINEHFDYLYNPKSDWTKYCKIAVFLEMVKLYVQSFQNNVEIKEGYLRKIEDDPFSIKKESIVYYNQLKNIKSKGLVIGTTNYNRFIEKVLKGQKVYYLNGCVDYEYDPYDNKILKTAEEKNENHHLTVPLIFTQTTTKPMTSVWMSEQYSEYYKKLKECKVVGVLGYGFNADDGFINSMIRELILSKDEDCQIKKVVVFVYPENDSFNENTEKKNLCSKLHLDFDEKQNPVEKLSVQNLKTLNENWTKILLKISSTKTNSKEK